MMLKIIKYLYIKHIIQLFLWIIMLLNINNIDMEKENSNYGKKWSNLDKKIMKSLVRKIDKFNSIIKKLWYYWEPNRHNN